MFDHILQKTRTVYWQYGNVTCAGYPLDDIDTIGKDGSLNDTSALSIIVRGVSEKKFFFQQEKIIKFCLGISRSFRYDGWFNCSIIK
jgi:hypothetical protein